MKNNLNSYLNRLVEQFDSEKLYERQNGQYSGIVYTPIPIAEFMVKNMFKIYIEDLLKTTDSSSQNLFLKGLDFDNLSTILKPYVNLKILIEKQMEQVTILDPACGSGRFLISAGKVFLKLYKFLLPHAQEFELKKHIIEHVLYGVEFENRAIIISKLRLLAWLYMDTEDISSYLESKIKSIDTKKLEKILEEFDISFNIFNLDFLLDYNTQQKFNFIIGNPPYIENKKILDDSYKNALLSKFNSAYRLFDLSILFLEKSLQLLKEDQGILSFIMTNKFLAADYGIKIRKILLNNTEIKEIINISSLPVFKKAASYPIIISFKKTIPHNKNKFNIQTFQDLEQLVQMNYENAKYVDQLMIKHLPSAVFPISGDMDLIRYIFSQFKPMSEAIKDLKIIYRPFGFTQWSKFFDNISENKTSENDMLLIGTGNVGKFYVNFDKRIRIAKRDIKISYFKYSQNFKEIWMKINTEKLIFREIAQHLTLAYDPGVFTNITGLYFITIPTYNTNRLFCLLSILNSKFMDFIFKSLFGTLHMSVGYLRFNGSFIRRLPIPDYFPQSLAYVGKINQFLSQLIVDKPPLDCEIQDLRKYQAFFINLADCLVVILYLNNYLEKGRFKEIESVVNSHDFFPDIEFKYSQKKYNLSKFKVYTPIQLKKILLSIKTCFMRLQVNTQLIKEMKDVNSFNKEN